MKKLLAIALCMMLLLCSCGGETGTQSKTSSTTSKTSSTSSSTSKTSSTSSTVSEKPQSSSKNETVSSKPSLPIDTTCSHSFSAATCTSAPRCTKCGQTSGSALGHSYSSATCTSAAKCTRCGQTNGSALGHNYSSGKCTRCGISDPSAPKIILPSVPAEYSYSSGSYVYSRCKVTSISTPTLDYSRSDGTKDYIIYVSGECTYNRNGSGQSSEMKIGYKIYDDDDIVHKSGTIYTESVAPGEKFKEELNLYYLEPGRTYRVVFSNVN